jgi:hypothetical protein
MPMKQPHITRTVDMVNRTQKRISEYPPHSLRSINGRKNTQTRPAGIVSIPVRATLVHCFRACSNINRHSGFFETGTSNQTTATRQPARLVGSA